MDKIPKRANCALGRNGCIHTCSVLHMRERHEVLSGGRYMMEGTNVVGWFWIGKWHLSLKLERNRRQQASSGWLSSGNRHLTKPLTLQRIASMLIKKDLGL